jgi:DNA polymerase-1
MPAPMVPQLDEIQKMTPWLGFRSLSLPDTEADDLMACYTIKARERGIEVVLATNDKDLYQLVNAKVKIYSTAKADLASPKDAFALLGEEEVTAKWDVPPAQIGDILAISGDAVDNIPGVGIGRKAAARLLREFGSLEALFASLDQIKTPKTREKLEASRERVRQNRKMVELDCDLPLPLPIDDLRIRPDYPRLIESMERYEFKSLLQDVRDEAARAGRAVQGELL